MSRRSWNELSGGQRTALVIVSAAELTLALAALVDLSRRQPDEVNGSKAKWAVVIGFNFVGPLCYFRWGRRTPDLDASRRAASPAMKPR